MFENLGTYDFEEVIREIKSCHRMFSIWNYISGNKQLPTKLSRLNDETKKLKDCLIKAIEHIHPSNSSVLDKNTYEKCKNFLNQFNIIYTINYDLLLYWTLMQSKSMKYKFKDGFWDKTGGKEVNYWDSNCKETNFFYLHGALHLFCDDLFGRHIYKLIYFPDLIKQVEKKITNNSFPLYVAEGDWHEKLKKIQSNDYLRYAYSSLKKAQGAIFTFGVSFEKDDHLLDAIQNSQVSKIFIGVRNKDSAGKIQKKFSSKCSFIDASKEVNTYFVPSVW